MCCGVCRVQGTAFNSWFCSWTLSSRARTQALELLEKCFYLWLSIARLLKFLFCSRLPWTSSYSCPGLFLLLLREYRSALYVQKWSWPMPLVLVITTQSTVLYNRNFHFCLYVFCPRVCVCTIFVCPWTAEEEFGSPRSILLRLYVTMWVLGIEPGPSGRLSILSI